MSLLANEPILDFLKDSDVLPTVAVLASFVFVTIIVLASIIRGLIVAKAREQTKRELAAYVAEGTIQPDDAVAILQSHKRIPCCGPRAREAVVDGARRGEHGRPSPA